MTQQEIMNYRADFPLLRESKVAYLDNAATSQRPDCVLDAQRKFYETHNANPCGSVPTGYGRYGGLRRRPRDGAPFSER